jgi:hypothetical protein
MYFQLVPVFLEDQGKDEIKSRLFKVHILHCRHVSLRISLNSNSYIILPTTFEPGQESSFTFRLEKLAFLSPTFCFLGEIIQNIL